MSSGLGLISLASLAFMSVFLPLVPLAFAEPPSRGDNITSNELQPLAFDGIMEGIHVEAPFYDFEVQELPEKRREFDANVMKNVSDLIINLTTDILIKKKSFIKIGINSIRKLSKFISDTKANVDNFAPDDMGAPIKDGFVKYMIHIFKDVLKETEEEKLAKKDKSKQKVKLTKEQQKEASEVFIKEFSLFLERLTKLTASNPVGLYLGWRNITMEEKPFIEVAHYFVKYFRDNGNALIRIGETLLSIVETFNWVK